MEGGEVARLKALFTELLREKISKRLENPTETLERSTNLEAVLLRQVKDIQMMGGHERGQLLTKTPKVRENHHSVQQPVLPFDDLGPQDRVECCDLGAAPNQVLWGKYLLCQTISPASKDVAFKVVVTDPKGSSGVELVLYNYSAVEESVLDVDFDEVLPPGSFLVLYNPWFMEVAGGFMLRCDNPAEVELVSRKRVEGKFPDIQWKGEVGKMTIHFFQKRLFWEELENDEAAFSKLKGLGNKGFVGKRFTDATRFYNMALDYCNENREDKAMICSNKSAALLALGCFNTALKCVEFSLEVDPENEKYNFRKTKALIGLRKYGEALNFLEGKFGQFPSLNKSKDCKSLLDSVKFFSSRKNIGPADLQLFSIRKATLNKDDINIPEFVGPLALVSQIEGKGRGLIATQDIQPGQLLICIKAFGYEASSSSLNQENSTLYKTVGKLVGKIANKLAFDPELGRDFYSLIANSELGHLESGDWRNGQVDMKRITEIVKTNSFGSEAGTIMDPEEPTGLWIFPSFLNHSCSEYNAVHHTRMEWQAVVAVAEIKKGQEVTLPYVIPTFDYDERQTICKSHEFTCTCKLCQLDTSEPIAVKNEREKILKSLEELTLDSGPLKIKMALKGVEKLVSFRKDNVPLNFPLLYPQIFRLERILVEKRRFGDAICLLNRMFEVATASNCWCFEGIDVGVSLICRHASRGDKKLMKEWIATVKGMVMKFYGSLEVSGIPFRKLKEQFGIEFFE